MELEIDKKEFERIQQELVQAIAENITLEYFEYEGKKWLNEDFCIPISVIQNKITPVIDELEKDGFVGYADELRDILDEILEKGNK